MAEMIKWFVGCWFALLFAVQVQAQCDGQALREIEFPISSNGLVQKWEFSSTPGNTVRLVEVHRAWWLGEADLLLWGHEEGNLRLGLYLLHKKASPFDNGTWSCQWESKTEMSAVGDFRNLTPIYWNPGKAQRLILKLEDEEDLGILMLNFPQSGLVQEYFEPLLVWDAAESRWKAPCLVSEGGILQFGPGLYREGWENQEQIKPQAQYVLGQEGQMHIESMMPPSNFDKTSKLYFVPLGFGHYLASPKKGKAKPQQLQSLASKLEATKGSPVMLHLSLPDFQKWVFEHDGPLMEE